MAAGVAVGGSFSAFGFALPSPSHDRGWSEGKSAEVYRTLDTYTITLSQPIHWDMVESFNRLLEEHGLLADFGECFNALVDEKFGFTTSCTYRSYKRFFMALYQAFGPFMAEVSFNEDYPPEGCGYNTSVNIQVDKEGHYLFALLNVLSADTKSASSAEYKRRIRHLNPPFEPNCQKEGHIFDLNKSGSA